MLSWCERIYYGLAVKKTQRKESTMKVFQFTVFFDPSKRANKEEKDDRKAKFLSGSESNPVETILASDEKGGVCW